MIDFRKKYMAKWNIRMKLWLEGCAWARFNLYIRYNYILQIWKLQNYLSLMCNWIHFKYVAFSMELRGIRYNLGIPKGGNMSYNSISGIKKKPYPCKTQSLSHLVWFALTFTRMAHVNMDHCVSWTTWWVVICVGSQTEIMPIENAGLIQLDLICIAIPLSV